MFRRTKQSKVETPQPSEEKKPKLTVAEQRIALTEHCGRLVATSCVAFNTELQAARERGLSTEEQDAYIKSLWAERKIPRIAAVRMTGHSTVLGIINPDKVEYVTIRDLESYDDHDKPAVNMPRVEQDYDRYPFEIDVIDMPVKHINGLAGYENGVVDPRFIPEVHGALLWKIMTGLRETETRLEEASVITETNGQ